MSNTTEKYDMDIDWLYAKAAKVGRKPTEAQEEQFAERVAIKAADEISENTARVQAFAEIFG